jgi:hypothetical protein
MAIRSLLIGLTLVLALVLVVLSILMVDPSQPLHQSEGLMPNQPAQQNP